MTYSSRYVTTLVCCLLASHSLANSANLPTTTDSITIDGIMNEAAWQQATQINVDIETHPGENISARVTTVAYLISDGEKIYIAFDARDPDPGQIRAYLQDRDSAWNDDFVGVVFDTYNDERRAFEFFANPLGVQMDLTLDDVNHNEDESWDAIWDAAGAISEHGYIVEMEIPLNQLRFPNSIGKQTWGIDLLRFYPRDKRYRFSNNGQDRERNCYLCNLASIDWLENIEAGRDLEVVPTLTSRKTDATDEPGVTPLQNGVTETEAGISIRWGITPDMTANVALNPDFSQVEADVAQLDVNNQFALFFPEKRPFFLEGADYFNTPISAVFTRTVADPDVGAKLTGKRGNHTYGVFAAQDSITNLIFPGSFGSDSTSLDAGNTAFVGRYSHSFGNASSVGALLTARSADNYYNHVGGFDLNWKITDNHYFKAQYLRTETEYPDDLALDFAQPLGGFSGQGTYARYNYDTRNWFAYLQHYHLDAGFRADAGFEPQVDVEQQEFGLGYKWHGTEDNWWTRIDLQGNWDITHDDSGRVLEREFESYLGVGGSMQSWFQFGYLTRDVLWDNQLFAETKLSLNAELQPRTGIALGVFMRYGGQIDYANSRLGDQLRMEPFLDWNLNRHLFLKLRATILALDTEQGEQIFDAAIYDLRLTWQFNRRSFLRMTTQYQNIERNVAEYVDAVNAQTRNLGQQLLFSYKINPQTVFFWGYSNKYFEDDALDRLAETDRTLFMKIGYAWTP